MTLTDRTRFGWSLILIGFAGAWAGPWCALMVVGVLLAWPRS